ncbi:MAG: ATP-binding protein [Patescibacteria group bacterium]
MLNPEKINSQSKSELPIDKSTEHIADNNIIEGSFLCSPKKTEAEIDAISEFLEKSFNQIKNRYFNELKDISAFYNLDVDQHEFCSRIMELVRNSLDSFIEQSINNGLITITFNFSENKISCTVRDSGGGIPLDQQQLLFLNRFPTTKKSSKHFGGRGLGLLELKKQLIEEGGDITYTPLEKGSEFIISIDPHKYNYDIPEAKNLTSFKQARIILIRHYLNKLKEIQAELIQDDSEKFNDLREYVKGWTSSDDEKELPYPLFIFQATTLQNDFNRLRESI